MRLRSRLGGGPTSHAAKDGSLSLWSWLWISVDGDVDKSQRVGGAVPTLAAGGKRA